ncbi:MAG: sensor histidine kinase, partial [Candidatus Izemoplasmataceae bacterium]
LQEKQQIEIIAHSESIRSNILKSISHDVRTPLTSISGCLETVLENDQIDESLKRRLLNDAMDDTNWMIRLIENILNVTKIQE